MKIYLGKIDYKKLNRYTMIVGLNVFGTGKEPYNLHIFEKILDYNHIEYIKLNINDPDFWNQIGKVDHYVYSMFTTSDSISLYKSILPVIEKYMKINLYPNYKTTWHYDDKIKEYYLLSRFGFPFAKSYIFWNKPDANNWIKEAELPFVFKLKSGSESDSVILVGNKNSAQKLTDRMFGKGVYPGKSILSWSLYSKDFTFKKFIHRTASKVYKSFFGIDKYPFWEKHKNYILFQEFQPDNKFDTRVMVIGKRAYAFRRFNRENDFRASGSANLNHDKDAIDKRFLKIAFEISEKLKFQSMAYDFLYDKEKEPIIAEISYTFPMKRKWPGYWDENLIWHSGDFMPQYFILKDLLNMLELRHPENESL